MPSVTTVHHDDDSIVVVVLGKQNTITYCLLTSKCSVLGVLLHVCLHWGHSCLHWPPQLGWAVDRLRRYLEIWVRVGLMRQLPMNQQSLKWMAAWYTLMNHCPRLTPTEDIKHHHLKPKLLNGELIVREMLFGEDGRLYASVILSREDLLSFGRYRNQGYGNAKASLDLDMLYTVLYVHQRQGGFYYSILSLQYETLRMVCDLDRGSFKPGSEHGLPRLLTANKRDSSLLFVRWAGESSVFVWKHRHWWNHEASTTSTHPMALMPMHDIVKFASYKIAWLKTTSSIEQGARQILRHLKR